MSWGERTKLVGGCVLLRRASQLWIRNTACSRVMSADLLLMVMQGGHDDSDGAREYVSCNKEALPLECGEGALLQLQHRRNTLVQGLYSAPQNAIAPHSIYGTLSCRCTSTQIVQKTVTSPAPLSSRSMASPVGPLTPTFAGGPLPSTASDSTVTPLTTHSHDVRPHTLAPCAASAIRSSIIRVASFGRRQVL